MKLPELDEEYARAVAESGETPQRLDDAMARVDGGFVDVNTYYDHVAPTPKGSGTPLVFAVLDDSPVCMGELLVRGADPNRTLPLGHGAFLPPAIFYARTAESLEQLVKGGARLDAPSQGGESYLHHCIRMSRVSRHPLWQRLAEKAIALGASPAQVDDAGQDAAAFALSMGSSIAKLYGPILGTVAAPATAAAPAKTRTAAKASAKKTPAKKVAAKKTPAKRARAT